jgi:hypothetical protein
MNHHVYAGIARCFAVSRSLSESNEEAAERVANFLAATQANFCREKFAAQCNVLVIAGQ